MGAGRVFGIEERKTKGDRSSVDVDKNLFALSRKGMGSWCAFGGVDDGEVDRFAFGDGCRPCFHDAGLLDQA